ncbi:unnamed protein product [Cyprideis torosa]|uniref:Globin domain-containing protein n=1 Tax=Cyprideis torosa TaxID=163714 RepID=A0A7R8WBI1_9CRUS|nr:unnamed protein product [Cyprideis torosa]CAG0886476.1 unnamed protein product [Cyprideis torosa]
MEQRQAVPNKVDLAAISAAFVVLQTSLFSLQVNLLSFTMADATGLTTEQKSLLKQSNDIMAKDMAGLGLDLFREVFNKHPEYQKRFRKIADMPVDEALKTTRMKSHATLVIGALWNIINSVTEPDLTMDLLETLGVRHKLMGWLSQSDFEKVFGILLDVLKDNAATKCTSDPAGTMEAWKAMLNTIGKEVGKQL